MRQEQKSKKPMIAGILMIIAFILAILTASGVFFVDIDTINLEEEVGEEVDQNFIETILNACGVLILVFGIFLLVGGIFAIKRVHWGISMLGAILGIFSTGPWFLGSILSLLALILLFLSKDEFKGEGEDTQPIDPTSFEQKRPQYLEEPEEKRSCPTCGNSMKKDKEYDTWYCENCQEYK